MYTATMRYTFTEGSFEKGCALWKTTVLEEAKKAEGLVRMQFLVAAPQALAIGTWKEKKYAEAFMKTGVFKRLMEQLKGLTASEPKSEIWELDSYFAS
jgi:quinol monooxygenase YgiN